MALIGKIREKSTLLVIFVGLGLLLFIVPFDRISSYFYGTGEQPIGSIEGTPMMESDWHYNYKIDSTISVYRQQYMQSGQVLVLDDQQNEQIKNNVWSQLVVGALFGKQLSEVPLSVGSKELNEIMIYGEEPSQVIKEMFTYDGNFAKDSVKPGIDRVLVGGKGAKAWLYSNVEKPIRSQRLRDKYTKMAKFGAYATTQDAKRKYLAENTKASIRYAFKEFSTIPDSVVTVEDNDIRTYFEAHKNEKKWKQETEVRTIEYVSFKISPSEEDKQRAMASMERKKLAFKKSVNDSLFVANNAATPIGANQQQQNQFQINSVDVLPTEPYKPGSGTFSVATDELITAAAKGDVVGPVSEGNKLQLIKVRDIVTKNEVTVRHILIKADEADAIQYKKKKAFADSLLRVLRADRSKFVDFVYKYSEDPGSNQPGKDGEYTFDKEINFVQEYKDFGFNKPVGTMEIVKTSFGFHIMENLRRGDNEYKMIAIVDANVKPSKVTRDLVYTEIVDGFYTKSKELGFEKAAEELNKEVKTAENVRIESPFIGELGKNMPLIKWNFNHEVGSISDPEFVSDELLAITSLKSEAHEGAPSFEGTKELMKPYVLKEKKAAYLLTKIGSATSVDDVAKAIDVTAESAEVNLGMNNLPGIAGAKEPEVMGTIFATEGGTTTKPIQGYNGLYVIEVTTKTAASVAENQDFSAEKGTLLGELRANVEAKLIESLAKAADFKDWRMKQQILNRD